MISIGNFFFKYRNWLFIILYLALFIPSPPIFSERLGPNYFWIPIILGLFITFSGEIIRGLTIGLAYIIRGGVDKKVYAENLVTTGMFSHVRNPLYVGNILMLLGAGILANSLIYLLIFIPLFLFIYQCIVLAEEHFLRNKFGPGFDEYCRDVNRWIPNPAGLGNTFRSMAFNGKRWLLKEYNTIYIWLSGLVLIIVLNYPQLFGHNRATQHRVLMVALPLLLLLYLLVRYLKKSGKMTEE